MKVKPKREKLTAERVLHLFEQGIKSVEQVLTDLHLQLVNVGLSRTQHDDESTFQFLAEYSNFDFNANPETDYDDTDEPIREYLN